MLLSLESLSRDDLRRRESLLAVPGRRSTLQRACCSQSFSFYNMMYLYPGKGSAHVQQLLGPGGSLLLQPVKMCSHWVICNTKPRSGLMQQLLEAPRSNQSQDDLRITHSKGDWWLLKWCSSLGKHLYANWQDSWLLCGSALVKCIKRVMQAAHIFYRPAKK